MLLSQKCDLRSLDPPWYDGILFDLLSVGDELLLCVVATLSAHVLSQQWALTHSVVHAPSVSLVSGTISMYLTTQESSVTSAGRLSVLI